MLRIIFLIIMLMIIDVTDNDLEKYLKLETSNSASVKKSDLPSEFSDEAFKVVDEFIRKTIDLDYEILLLFDYITGDILKCKIGEKNIVKLNFKDNEFSKHNIATIHNHTKEMYTPPSDKNFGIFSREWEDYELIAANNCLWILKGKINDDTLTFELKINSRILFNMTLDYFSKRYSNTKEKNNRIDEEYGNLLKNYINNKNINKLQLIKREYSNDRKNC